MIPSVCVTSDRLRHYASRFLPLTWNAALPITLRQDPAPIEDKRIDEDTDIEDDLETDSGSHNESTEPLSPHLEAPPPPVEDQAAKDIATMKKFWAKYVVPKNGRVGDTNSVLEDGKDDDAMSQDSSQDKWPFIDVGDVGSETELNEALAEISEGCIPIIYHRKGRAFTFLPSGYNPPPYSGPDLPDTPEAPRGNDSSENEPDENGDEPPASPGDDEASDDGSIDDGIDDEPYNPEGKGDVMPACGRWNLEHLCQGPGCKNCQLVLGGESIGGLLDLEEETNQKKRKSETSPGSSSTTMKTPPPKKPTFYGSAVVDAPEKVVERTCDDEAQRGGNLSGSRAWVTKCCAIHIK